MNSIGFNNRLSSFFLQNENGLLVEVLRLMQVPDVDDYALNINITMSKVHVTHPGH